VLSFFTAIPSLGRSTRPDYSRVSIFIQSVVETISGIHPIIPIALSAPIAGARSVGPIRLAEAEHVFQTLAGIFLIELLAVVGGAGVPAITAERVVLAAHAQLIHWAIHWVE
jgi:hypothetical protein